MGAGPGNSIERPVTQAGAVVATGLKPASTSVRLLALFLAGILAGFVAARIAGRGAILHGAMTAWPLAAILVASALLVPKDFEWTSIGEIVLGALCGAVGGWLASRTEKPSRSRLV